MKQFPANIQFKYTWRKYQQRVLDELDEHLEDNHLHVIAPPGSGKTILGLEVALRINKPTLILAPTLAIRNQWIHRFCELFLQQNMSPSWISKDIKNPKFLTVATYQSLFAACNNLKSEEIAEELLDDEIDIEDDDNSSEETDKHIIEILKEQNIGTIVVDEAHHLKNAWWKSLNEVKQALNPTIVGLTATPPYDVSVSEWHRYLDLNGPVDAEISVPELVVEGDLCPHQDLVFFSNPTQDEKNHIREYRRRLETLFAQVLNDKALVNAIELHPVMEAPDENLEWIYSNVEKISAMLIFLHAAGREIGKQHLKILDTKISRIPSLDYSWMEILLDYYLFREPRFFEGFKEHQEELTNRLKRNGALHKKSITFNRSDKLNKLINSSVSKLDSINQIVTFESANLKEELRLVILTDYIRKEFLVSDTENTLELDKIGVMSIFERLRRNNDKSNKLAVLTGSLIIIPISALPLFKEIAAEYDISKVSTVPLNYDNQFLIVTLTSQVKHHVVKIVTRLFECGEVKVLVGTKSLLGEGWDAPSINSLILASFVGSYVLSNQMRGRAIRSTKDDINKVGNIWHLVCIDQTSPEGGDDYQLLERRFKTFVGISFHENGTIENGIARLDLDYKTKPEQNNNLMLNYAANRELLKDKWDQALKEGTSLIEEIKIPFPEKTDYQSVKSLYLNKTIAYLFASLCSGIAIFVESLPEIFMRSMRSIRTTDDILRWIMIMGVVALVLFGGKLFKTVKLLIKYRDISKDLHNIGEALLNALIKVGLIHTHTSKLNVNTIVTEDGSIYCHLDGATTFEKSQFISSLEEIVGGIDNPRYIIVRKGLILNLVSQKDYHSVPNPIGQKKSFAQFFESQWSRLVGSCELVYCRTIEGRKLLLRSRKGSLASEFQQKSERVNKWR